MNARARLVMLILLIVSLAGMSSCNRRTAGTQPGALPQGSETDIKLGLHAPDAVGEKHYLVILADFPDVQRTYSTDLIGSRLLDFLSNYYYEASYHNLTFMGEMIGPYVLPDPIDEYKIASSNLGVDDTRIVKLVTDVANLVDEDVEFTDDLYVVIALGALQSDYGMIGYSAVPGMLNFTNDPIVNQSGEVISKAVVFCENAHLGTYIHDTLHILGGTVNNQRMTPCLYDHDLQAQYWDSPDQGPVVANMGFWDPLSSHFPYDRTLPPTGLSAWTKLRLGWIDPDKVALVYPGQTATIQLDPLVNDDAETLVIRIPLSASTYYLIENRQPIESDANLPSLGVLITYADDTVLECRHGNAPVKIMDANPDVLYFNDAAYDIGKNETFIDRQNNVAIELVEKVGQSYLIRITTPDQVGSGN